MDRQFISSSRQWGEASGARICQIVMDANSGAAQQVVENRTDLLDFLELKDLTKCDDFGLSLPFLAVYYDRPEILQYLRDRGVDLSLPCDAMEFGNPMYYAVTLEKPNLIRVLHKLGCYVTSGCDAWFNLTPTHYASRIDNDYSKAEVEYLTGQTQRAATFLIKNFYRHKYRKLYLAKLRGIRAIQRCVRGMLGRIYCELKRSGQLSEEDSYSLREGSSSILRGEDASSVIQEETSSALLAEENGDDDDDSAIGGGTAASGSGGSGTAGSSVVPLSHAMQSISPDGGGGSSVALSHGQASVEDKVSDGDAGSLSFQESITSMR